MSVFALTFAYNETFFLPRWTAYYGRQLGLENLYVLDHGSNDLSTMGLGPVNIIKVPRTPYDEVKRIFFGSYMHSALLQYHSAGFVMDVDEFIVADPIKYKTLRDFAMTTQAPTLACIGLELCHVRAVEPEFSEYLPILSQREHVYFDSWMCKRSFGKIPIRFGGGFHTSDQPVEFDEGLFLIHLKNFDYRYRLVRQQITANWNYSGDFGLHARRAAEYVDQVFDGVDSRVASGNISHEFSFKKEIETCLGRTAMNPSGEYDFNLDGGFQSPDMYLLPSYFHDLF
jgi:Glycosyl transferase family 2